MYNNICIYLLNLRNDAIDYCPTADIYHLVPFTRPLTCRSVTFPIWKWGNTSSTYHGNTEFALYQVWWYIPLDPGLRRQKKKKLSLRVA